MRIVVTLLLAAFLGGIINALRERRLPARESDPASSARLSAALTWTLPLLQSVAAAGTVPLFLSLTKSALLKDALSSDLDLATVFGLAVIASISARAFLDGITKKALQDIDDNKQQLAKTEDKVTQLEDGLDEGEARVGTAVGDTPGETLAPHVVTTDDETKVLKAMRDSKWIKRTIPGLKREVELIPGTDFQAVLDSLTSQHLLTRHEPTDTQTMVRWSLSPDGKRMALTLPRA